MSKRGASSELNHDNWDAEEDDEQPGTFVPLQGSQIQNRIIRKAKRSLNNTSSDSQQASSPFASFSGFSKSTSSASPFSFLQKSSGDNKSPLIANSKKFGFKTENGESTLSQKKKSEEPAKGPEKTVPPTSITSADQPSRSLEYYKQLQSLNESVLKWMQLHLAKNSCCDFTPVFNDYKKHMDTLNVTYPFRKEAFAAKEATSNIKSSDFFKRSTESTTKESKNHIDVIIKYPKGDDETDYGNHFSSNTTNTSTFSFGIQCTPSATSSGSAVRPNSSSKEGEMNKEEEVNKEAEINKEVEPAPQFSFGYFSKQNNPGADKSVSFATGNTATTASNEDQEYVPPKNDFVAVSEEGAIYSKRCKLFFKKGEDYTEKGVGTLYLKPLEGKTQLLIRADTSLGNILLNILLSASLPMSRTGKNNVLILCIPNPPVDAKIPDSKEAIPILIRVKTSADADELLETLKTHKS